MNYFYTGIGSRKTPFYIRNYFKRLGSFLARKNFILRSGHAPAADVSFEKGCEEVSGVKEIFIPWKNFENSNSNLIVSNPKAFQIAAKFHPNWDSLSSGSKKLLARDSHEILGVNLESPSNIVICWTKDGKENGGTGQSIRIAKYYNIPIFNAGDYFDITTIKKELKVFLLKNTHLSEKDFQK